MSHRRFRPRRHRSAVVWLAILILIGLRLWYAEQRPQPSGPLAEGMHHVERVVDGDTLLIDNHRRVRLIGVDTPETVKPDHPVEPLGPEATAFTRDFVRSGEVRLEFDEEKVDQHGRYLAYVWVGDRMLNEELLRAGLGRFEHWYRFSPAKKRRFRAAQDAAKHAGRGIWQ